MIVTCHLIPRLIVYVSTKIIQKGTLKQEMYDLRNGYDGKCINGNPLLERRNVLGKKWLYYAMQIDKVRNPF